MTQSRGSPTRFGAVDRVDAKRAVIVLDDGGETQVPLNELRKECRVEGAVLRVPLRRGAMLWNEAVRDYDEERRRKAELQERVDLLKKQDPGGDLNL